MSLWKSNYSPYFVLVKMKFFKGFKNPCRMHGCGERELEGIFQK